MSKHKEDIAMKFFHVYNERCFKGLEKNNLLNEDSAFKIQHVFSMPKEIKFNEFAAKGSKLHSLIKENNIPFYVDRIAGGVTYHEYDFDPDLIREYESILGDWFLGFQHHESASNMAEGVWPRLVNVMGGNEGPYDLEELKEKMLCKVSMDDGTPLYRFAHGTPEYFANQHLAKSPEEFIEQMRDIYKVMMDRTLGHILPCDSYHMLSKMQLEMGMNTLMPEVGWQISDMRIAVATARGMAEAFGKRWGTYYETWIAAPTEYDASMPCFNDDPINEWYLTQEQHGDDFTTHGHAGGSSRLLQKRIYYYSLMSGADYLAEEWGLNCSYTSMETFDLSPYGLVKKEFIDFARNYKTVKAKIPFAIVLPLEYAAVQLHNPFRPYGIGQFKERYLNYPIPDSQRDFNGHIEDVLKLAYVTYGNKYGNEGHVMTNSRFGDLFDIIYEDASDEVFAKYDALIDASPDGRFAAKKGDKYKVFESSNLEKLESDLRAAEKEAMPCTVDKLHWLVSGDADGRRYLSVFNNEGNYRMRPVGDTIDNAADTTVTVTFKGAADINPIKLSAEGVKIHKVDEKTYKIDIPAAQFAIVEF